MNFFTEFSNTVSKCTPSEWVLECENFKIKEDLEIYLATLTNTEGNKIGKISVYFDSSNQALVFDELYVTEEGQSVFKKMCKNFAVFARTANLTNFVVIDQSEIMKNLLFNAGFIVIDIFSPQEESKETIIKLINKNWPYFGQHVYYADVSSANSTIDKYGNS